MGVQVLMDDVLLGSYHVTTEGSPGRQATLDTAQVIIEGSPEWQATPDNAQLFLESGLQTWPALCCTEGFAYFESHTRGAILHSCSHRSQDCANATMPLVKHGEILSGICLHSESRD